MLTPSAVQNAKPRDKPYKLFDERGLFLLVNPNGSRWWRWKYRRPDTGKENLLSLGTFPDVSLKRAREKRDDARKLLADGIDPGAQRIAAKVAQADSFEAVAREWHAKQSATWSAVHAKNIMDRFERDVFPWIGATPVAKLTAPELLATLRRLESRGAVESAHRALGNAGQVMRYAIATGRAERDVAADLRGALAPVVETHRAAITEPAAVAGLLRAIHDYRGSPVTAAALKLAPLLFVRPGELRQAEWSEIDFDAAEWNIPAERMKMRVPHLVPLSEQAVAILRELQPLTSRSLYVFPGAHSSKRPMSNNAVLAALRRMGFAKDEMSGHGFRAMARTILDEVLGFRPDYIEHQLAHAVRDPNGRAYNRTAHLAERRKMMQGWSDYLDGLRTGADVLPFKRKAS
ncbi:MAG: integrase arm-type DNA-binding domain-containing protein [Lysobacteraceae bacterium]